ncbi:MAG: crotonase/enoyl-CoA hydratase family protein, partial [Actinomycetes bacterium]
MSDSHAPVRVEGEPPVATVVLDRPQVRNAVDRATAETLAEVFRRIDADPRFRAAVLWGAGGTFCAGADLRGVAAGDGNRVAADGDGPMGPTRMTMSIPVIAAISGYAVAGGLELALWCDLRVVESDAILGVFCRRFGVPLVDGGTVRLPRIVGLGRALDLILTGRPVDATQAYGMGLATRVVPPGRARAEAEALAHQLAAAPATCLREDRASVYECLGLPEPEALATEHRHGLVSLAAGADQAAATFVAGAGRHGQEVCPPITSTAAPAT